MKISTYFASKSFVRHPGERVFMFVFVALIMLAFGTTIMGVSERVSENALRKIWCEADCVDRGSEMNSVVRGRTSFGASFNYTCWCNDHSSLVIP